MKVFCPTCEKETECNLPIEVYTCTECNEDFADYDNPLITKLESEVERLQIAEIDKIARNIRELRLIAENSRLIAFLRKCYLLDVFRPFSRLRDEGLKILFGDLSDDNV